MPEDRGDAVPYAYAFDHRHRRPPKDMKDLLGGKGANLAEMTSVLKLPVPPGFTITTDACRAYMASGWPTGLTEEVERNTGRLERAMRRRLGDANDPLLVSVRSGAKFSMPGMMDTVLNLGLNDRSVKGLAKVTSDERFAYDSYRRFIAMYGRIVLGIDAELFDKELEAAKEAAGVDTDAEVPADALRELCATYKRMVKDETRKPFPQDPQRQLRGAIQAVFASWDGARARAYREREKIPHDLGTAVNVQVMVFGNRDDRSGTGVGFTRNAATGEDKPYGDFLVNAQGEDVVAGIRNTLDLGQLGERFPDIHDELLAIFDRLEAHYRDMCDTEFTIEQDKLWMLQTRVGKRTGRAALRMAVEMTQQKRRKGWAITRNEALLRITEDHLDQVLHPQFAPSEGRKVVATGPGRVAGRRGGGRLLLGRRRRRGRGPGRAGRARAHRDVPRGRARHAGLRGHPHRPGRPGQPRGGGRPRLGHPRGGRRRGDPDRGHLLHRRRRHRVGGRRALARRQHRRGRRRGGRADGVVRTRGAGDDPGVGRRRAVGAQPPAAAPRRAGQRRHRRRRRHRPRRSAPRASACAAPSTCSWPRTGCRSCGR